MRHIIFTFWCFIIFFCTGFSAYGQVLFNYLPESAKQNLSRSQKHFYETAMSWPYAINARIATVNTYLFQQDRVVFNLNYNQFTARKEARNTPFDSERISWIGQFEEIKGDVHAVFKQDGLVAFIQFDYLAFVVRPLGEGLHAVIQWDMTLDDGCLTPTDRPFEHPNGDRENRPRFKDHPDLQKSAKSVGAHYSPPTGECNVRVLVAFTQPAEAAVPDILMDIVNMINIANTGYLNSSTGTDDFRMSIELAAAFRTGYPESGDMDTDLDCITDPNCLEEIHLQRQLWKADQCALLTSTGSGLAWVSTAYGNQFSVTGVPNFYAFTFHHELGHNARCTHAPNQASQPGTSPYAGWGEPTTGCFRTVMAYSDACGMDPCPRHNIFSDDDPETWECGGTLYMPGSPDHRNQDRLTLSYPILVAHETAETDELLTAAYTWTAREAVHVAAGNSLTYNSPVNNFLFMPQSQGSFRAGYEVVLGRGFLASSGSNFRAYIDNCDAGSSLIANSETEKVDGVELPTGDRKPSQFHLYPNPTSSRLSISFSLPEDGDISLNVLNQYGQVVEVLEQKNFYAGGAYTLEAALAGLPPGLYYVNLKTAYGIFTKPFVLSRF